MKCDVWDYQHFFKPSRTKEDQDEKKIWLNLSGTKGAFSQILIGFKEGATPGFDTYFDGKRLSANTHIELYSELGSKNLAIRGEPPLTGEKKILLGVEVKSDQIDSLRIEIDHLTPSMQTHGIYLHDREKDVLHNLKEGGYEFTASGPGTYEERFIIQFYDRDNLDLSLGEEEEIPDTDGPDKIIWSLQNQVLDVRTLSNSEILELRLYDMLGRTLVSARPRDIAARIIGLDIAHNAVYFLQLSTKKREILTTQILHL